MTAPRPIPGVLPDAPLAGASASAFSIPAVTLVEAQILHCVTDFRARLSRGPDYREIAKAVGLRPTVVVAPVAALHRKGLVSGSAISRSLRPVFHRNPPLAQG